MKESLVLFLDFDGVFHHVFPLKENTDEQNSVFYYTKNVEEFCSTLKNFFDLKIVFATSWKEKFSFEDLKGFFEDFPSLHSSIYGSTPNIKNLSDEGYKWKEAEVWIKENQYTGKYLILDDYNEVWKVEGKDNSNIIVCKDKFDSEEIREAYHLLNIGQPYVNKAKMKNK